MTTLYPKRPKTARAESAAPPPSYDVATRSSASPRRLPPLNPSPDEQCRVLSKEGQYQREQELYSYGGYPAESSRSLGSSSSREYASSTSASMSSALYGGMPFDPATRLARYGNPFASSADWRPSPDEGRLTQLPELELNLRIKMRFSGPSVEQRTLSPPPSFYRRFQTNDPASAAEFEPIYIRSANSKQAKKQLLSDGFRSVFPGRLMMPRDVSAADWSRFLEDIVVAGRLSGAQSIFSNVAPITMHLGATGYFVTKAIEKRMKARKDPLICETVETWQHNFFSARNLDVYILHNGQRITARSPNAPIPAHTHPISEELHRYSTSYLGSGSGSVSSSDSHDECGRGEKLDKRQKKLLRAERKAEKKLERAQKKYGTPAPQYALGSAPSNQAVEAPRHRGGYLLVIAPLSRRGSELAGEAAAFMW